MKKKSQFIVAGTFAVMLPLAHPGHAMEQPSFQVAQQNLAQNSGAQESPQQRKEQRQEKQQERQKAREQRQEQRQQAQEQKQPKQEQRQQTQEQRQQRQEQRQKAREQRQEQRQQTQEQRQPKQAQEQKQQKQQQKQQAQEPRQQKQEQRQKAREQRQEQRQQTQEQRQDRRQDAQQERRQDRRQDAQEQRQDPQRQDAQERRQEQRQDRREDAREQRQDRREEAREERREDAQQARRLEDLRDRRRETREGNRTVIREPGRTIIREDGRTIIRHDEVDRFRRLGGQNVRVERRGNERLTIVARPGGYSIVTVTDNNGRLVRRVRRYANGREVVIIDNRRRGGPGFFVQIAPPVVRIPRERYIVEAAEAAPALLYDTLVARPVEKLERAYALDEIRYSQNLRERMPRIDLDTVTFETGSWEVAPAEAARLEPIAQAMRRAIEQNQQEVFLIEGHTDAIGEEVDNLSLSDRRAEAVAIVLTDQFGVPPENLTTQGYGEQYLKVSTDAAERRNRRVTVRRITPLLAGQSGESQGSASGG